MYLGLLGLLGTGSARQNYSSVPALAGTQPDTLKTGVEMKIRGTVSENSVHADISMKLTTLIRFREYPSGLFTLRLPETFVRSLDTAVRVRPGDVAVLAGMLSSNDQRTVDGITENVPTNRNRDERRTEVVMILRPRVIEFVR
jgi:type II secretory pathway component GspD/PulD (secretin)